MGRPNKFNLSYFPLDIGFFDDHKVISIEETAGIKGGYIALRIMAMAYADQGYYLEWPEKFEFTAAKRIGNGVTGASVAETLKLCLKFDLFNKEVFEEHQVITSTGIQKRWLMVMNILRRKIEVNSSFWLIPSEETRISSEETPKNAAESTQKEIKGNEIKRKNTVGAAEAGTATDGKILIPPVLEEEPQRKKNTRPRRQPFVAPTLQEVTDYFTDRIGDPQDARSWTEDKIRTQASKFFNHYTANGWVQGRQGKPLVDWKAAVRNWIQNELEHVFSPSPAPTAAAPAINYSNTTHRKPTRTLSNMEQDINYLFETFLDGKCTWLSVESNYYDHMKQRGMISFSDEEATEIKATARENLEGKNIPVTDQSLLTMMKKVGLLTFFGKLKKEDRTAVFTLEES